MKSWEDRSKELFALSSIGKCIQSFHGRTYGTLSLTGNSARKKGGGPYMPGVAFAPAPYCYRCPLKLFNTETCGMACAEALADVIKFEMYDKTRKLYKRRCNS